MVWQSMYRSVFTDQDQCAITKVDNDDYDDDILLLCVAQLLRKSLPATIGEYKNHPLCVHHHC